LDLLTGDLSYPDDRQSFAERFGAVFDLTGDGLKNTATEGAAEDQAIQQRHFDRWATSAAQSYTAYNLSKFWRNMDAGVFQSWVPEVDVGECILDVGCGDGRAGINFADCDVTVVGVDVSKRLVETAARRFAERGGLARSYFIAADATRFPFQEETFDRVVVYGVLHHLPDVEVGCREIARVLKEGGVYFGHENNASVVRGLFDALQEMWPQWVEEAGAEPLIDARDIIARFRRYGVDVTTRTSVFVPPHLVNVLPEGIGRWLYRLSEVTGGSIPVVRNNGGILLLRGNKRGLAVGGREGS